jgi:hypothetical protein
MSLAGLGRLHLPAGRYTGALMSRCLLRRSFKRKFHESGKIRDT